jgi:arylamine N-acetyltransferase
MQLDRVSAAESGDYYQVNFEAADDGDGPYVLVQRQFEDDDGGRCYLETHDQDYIGHFRVVRATLDRHRFCLELHRKKFSTVEATFKTTEENYMEVSRILRIMIPCLAVAGEGGATGNMGDTKPGT